MRSIAFISEAPAERDARPDDVSVRRVGQLSGAFDAAASSFAWQCDKIVKHLGGDPDNHIAVGVGYGLERLAMLRYGIDDIRKIEGARVA